MNTRRQIPEYITDKDQIKKIEEWLYNNWMPIPDELIYTSEHKEYFIKTQSKVPTHCVVYPKGKDGKGKYEEEYIENVDILYSILFKN